MDGSHSRRVEFFPQAERSFLDVPPVSTIPAGLEESLLAQLPEDGQDGALLSYLKKNRQGAEPDPSPRARSGEGSAEPPGPTIRGGGNRQSAGLDVALWGGVDGLEGTLFGKFTESYGVLELALEKARQAALEKCGDRTVQGLGWCGVVQAKGHRWANTFFHWVVEWDGIKISLAKSDQSERCPIAKVKISSLKLMRHGAEQSWAEAMRMLELMGLVVESSTLYRYDVCLDLPGVPVGPYCEAVSDGQAVRRIRSRASFDKNADGTWQGVSVGTREGVRVVIYDKLQELIDHGGPEAEAKTEVLVEQRWGCLPACATRVEFQIRGEWLRRRWENCASVEQALAVLPEVTAYLVNGFFRIVDGAPDRDNNNQTRAPLSPIWRQVVEGFVGFLGAATKELVKVEKRGRVTKAAALKRLVRSAIQVAAFTPERAVSREEFLQLVAEELNLALPFNDDRRLMILQDIWNDWEARGVLAAWNLEKPQLQLSSCPRNVDWMDEYVAGGEWQNLLWGEETGLGGSPGGDAFP